MRSLDAPLGPGSGSDEPGTCLLDLLAAPAVSGPQEEAAGDGGAWAAERQWLRSALETLDSRERELLMGRLQVGCTWVELGRQLGMPPRQAQRRCSAVLARLQRAAEAWREQGGSG